MTYCIVPGCAQPHNSDIHNHCQSCGSPLLLQQRYRPLSPLSQGGFGKTFIAADEQMPLKPHVVVKQLAFSRENPESYQIALRLFQQEATRLNELGKHPQIPQLYATFEQDGYMYLVEEFIQGHTLEEELKDKGVFKESEILELLDQLLPVLQFIHERNIVHRDIKPANIMRRTSQVSPLQGSLVQNSLQPKSIESFPSSQKQISVSELSQQETSLSQPSQKPISISELSQQETSLSQPSQKPISISELSQKQISVSPSSQKQISVSPSSQKHKGDLVLIDFGIAKVITGTTLIKTGTIIGSPEYMAPEQTRGKAVPASDLFSLGVTCIHLLTAASPWDMYDMTNDRWLWRPFLPNGVNVRDRVGKILDKLLQSAVSSRYQKASEVLQALHPPQVSLSRTPKAAAKPTKTPHFWEKLFPHRLDTREDDLTSAVGLDYQPLQNLLSRQQWKEADLETWGLLCDAIGKRRRSYLYPQELTQLPCADLLTIDRLWVKYSKDQFGFSIQSQIYENVERDYGKFCDQIGWLTYNPHNPSEGLQFKLSAPSGHLPSRIWTAGSKWWQHAEVIADKFKECDELPSRDVPKLFSS
jgi:serine/threonine protein kinase